jgi:hypoxanthine phosphoribosyltransferase
MLKMLYTRKKIDRAVKRLASLIQKDFGKERIVFVCILKGSFMFTADLVRHISNPCRVDFIRATSYGAGMTTTGSVALVKDVEESIEGENVVIVEDILDSGLTLVYIRDLLQSKGPKSLKICALIDKRARRQVEIEGDYVGLTIDDDFVVGYGIDFAEEYRNLPDIYVVEQD